MFLSEIPLIDVRAEVEFAEGSLPNAVNLPIMNNEERAKVGTAYKVSGREVAMALGHRLVSGEVKTARLKAWTEQIEKNPTAVFYCYRGGLRSKITQQWLKEAGIDRPLIEGGFKNARQYLRNSIDECAREKEFLMLSGPTGSAKTRIIALAGRIYPSVDLEALARHRGSAFGAWSEPQPPQVDFENQLAVSLLKLKAETRPLLLEDESRLIGRSVLPPLFFDRMRASEVLLVTESFELRVQNIFEDYVLGTDLSGDDDARISKVYGRYQVALHSIGRRLGGLRLQEIRTSLQNAEFEHRAGRGLEANKIWISQLLQYYYDPIYRSSLDKRNPKILFQGRSAEILDKLKIFRAGC